MKFKKSMIYTMWSAAIVLCVALSVFMLLFTSCSKSQSGSASQPTGGTSQDASAVSGDVTDSPDGSGQSSAKPDAQTQETDDPLTSASPDAPDGGQTTTPVTTEPTAARLGETADAGQEYIDKLVFLGDSTTYGMVYYGVLSGGTNTKQVWTPASGTLTLSYYSVATIVYPETGEELSIVDAVTRAQPEYLVITLGVNGISFMDEEWFIRDYTSLVTEIQSASPNTKIILNSIYPIAQTYAYQGDINNDKINAANGWIEQIAENTGTRFLYSFESIVGSDGWLPEDYHNGDGLHLNTTSFNLVLDYMRTHAYN